MLSQYSLLYAHNSSFGVIKKKKKKELSFLYKLRNKWNKKQNKKQCRTKRKRKKIRGKRIIERITERKEMRSTDFRMENERNYGWEDRMRSRKRGRREGKTCEKKKLVVERVTRDLRRIMQFFNHSFPSWWRYVSILTV